MPFSSIIIMIAAGASSVLLLTAGLLKFPFLLALAPLPIAIASLGWGTLAGIGAAIMGLLTVVFLSQPNLALGYAAAFGGPAAYLGHLIGLSRQDDPDQPAQWFSLGEILFRAALIGGVVIGIAMVAANFNVAAFTKASQTAFGEILKDTEPQMRDAVMNALAFQVKILPFAAPAVWLLMLWFNLWLGVKVVKLSGRLNRPSFSLSNSAMPIFALIVLAVGIGGTFVLSEPLVHAFGGVAGAMAMAFAIMGCATMNVLTRKNSLRGLILGVLYSSIIFFGFPLLIMVGLGLADLFFNLRQRFIAANPTQ